MAQAGVQIEGLREFTRALREIDRALGRELQQIHKGFSGTVASAAQSSAPRRSGKLAGTIKARATQRDASITGGRGIAYFGLAEFGGSVPTRKGQKRPRRFVKPYKGPLGRVPEPWYERSDDGYFFYPAARAHRKVIEERYSPSVARLMKIAFPRAG